MSRNDTHLVERRVDGQRLLKGKLLEVWRDRIALPDGGEATREYIVHNGAVMVVPILDDGRLVLERQYRYPLEQVLLEFPAGKIDPGEPTLNCAVRELREETGYSAHEWALGGRIHNAASYSTEIIEIWFARGLTLGERALDAGEFIEVVLMSEDELAEQARRGTLTDAKTLIGLAWLQNWRGGRWPLSWQATC